MNDLSFTPERENKLCRWYPEIMAQDHAPVCEVGLMQVMVSCRCHKIKRAGWLPTHQETATQARTWRISGTTTSTPFHTHKQSQYAGYWIGKFFEFLVR